MFETVRSMTKFLLPMAFVSMAALAACDDDGPAERAGEKVDKAVEETGEAIKEVTK